jgi:hypothetical protein
VCFLLLFRQASRLSEDKLVSYCIDEIDGNCERVIESDSFLDMDEQFLSFLLDRSSLMVAEVDLYRAVIRWSERRCELLELPITVENRKKVLSKLLPKIRFPLMTADDFFEAVIPDHLLNQKQLNMLIKRWTSDSNLETEFSSEPRNGPYGRIYFAMMIVDDKCWDSTFEIVFTVDIDVYLRGCSLRNLIRDAGVTYCFTVQSAERNEAFKMCKPSQSNVGQFHSFRLNQSIRIKQNKMYQILVHPTTHRYTYVEDFKNYTPAKSSSVFVKELAQNVYFVFHQKYRGDNIKKIFTLEFFACKLKEK